LNYIKADFDIKYISLNLMNSPFKKADFDEKKTFL
jgi:hypothetical protein